jgi:hypothetical protein
VCSDTNIWRARSRVSPPEARWCNSSLSRALRPNAGRTGPAAPWGTFPRC